MPDNFENQPDKKETDTSEQTVKREEYRCPHCNDIINAAYIKQNPLSEIPCPSCSSLIDMSSIVKKEFYYSDERTDKRCNIILKVTYQDYDKFITEYTKNVSNGGMFLNTNKRYEKGSKVSLFLHVPGLEEPLKILGEIVHVNFSDYNDENNGVGIKFIDINELSRQALIKYIRSHKHCF